MSSASSAAQRWDEAHACSTTSSSNNNTAVKSSSNTPSHLYTDENPATTTKGTGFKNKRIAERTILLTSQPFARYKQYWTIRAMRERAANHPNPTEGMMHAINVFDEWLHNYKEESDDEKMIQKKEWLNYKKMCTTNGANGHWYGKNPSSNQLKRAREDVTNGQRLLMKLLSRRRSNGKESACVDFPLISFVALFGGGGKHGYGEHSIIIDNEQSTSRVEINGTDGLEELIGGSKLTKLGLLGSLKIHLQYHRKEEKATVMVEQSSGSILTLDRLWRKSSTNKCTSHVYNAQVMEEKDSSTYYVANTVKHQRKDDESGTPVGTIKRRKLNGIIVIAPEENSHEQSWTCFICTFVHIGPAKLNYLSCEICGSERD